MIPLSAAYKMATLRYYGYAGKVPVSYSNPKTKGFVKLSDFEKYLSENELDSVDYSYHVVSAWGSWYKRKHDRKMVPFGLLLTEKALARFMETSAHRTVKISSKSENNTSDLNECELIVASSWTERCLSTGEFVRFSEIVNELRGMLSVDWLRRYEQNSRSELIGQSIKTLSVTFDLDGTATSYSALLTQLSNKRSGVAKRIRENRAVQSIPNELGMIVGF